MLIKHGEALPNFGVQKDRDNIHRFGIFSFLPQHPWQLDVFLFFASTPVAMKHLFCFTNNKKTVSINYIQVTIK
jgi:hypothetical protein